MNAALKCVSSEGLAVKGVWNSKLAGNNINH